MESGRSSPDNQHAYRGGTRSPTPLGNKVDRLADLQQETKRQQIELDTAYRKLGEHQTRLGKLQTELAEVQQSEGQLRHALNAKEEESNRAISQLKAIHERDTGILKHRVDGVTAELDATRLRMVALEGDARQSLQRRARIESLESELRRINEHGVTHSGHRDAVIDQFRSDLRHRDLRIKALEEELAKTRHVFGRNDSSKHLLASLQDPSLNGEEKFELSCQLYAQFLKQRAELVGFLTERCTYFTLLQKVPVESADLKSLRSEYQQYATNVKASREELLHELRDIPSTLQNFRHLAPPDTAVLEELWRTLSRAEEGYLRYLDGEERRRHQVEMSRRIFEGKHRHLLDWCRLQKSTLDATTNPDEVQLACRHIQNSMVEAEPKYAELEELAAPLYPNRQVDHALREAKEVLLNLMVTAHERLRDVLYEIHPTRTLEQETKTFAPVCQSLQEFLVDIESLLKLPTDDESLEVVRPALDKCHALQRDLRPFQLLTDHLSEFSVRMECVRENYDMLRRMLFTGVTWKTGGVDNVVETYERSHQEVERHLADLKMWIQTRATQQEEVPSGPEAWEHVQDQVAYMKDLIAGEVRRAEALPDFSIMLDDPEEF